MVERILDAAARIFESEGYHATTTNHVADEAGVSIGSLYQYFPNKDALLVGLGERHVAEAIEHLTSVASQLRDAAPGLEQTCRAFVMAAVALNQPSELHRVLWVAPRTAALEETLHELDRMLAVEVAWHLRRFGHSEELAEQRAAILMAAVSAVIHQVAVDESRNEELVRLCVAYARVS
jgi:AcrR family transcriptional regulator